jgi:RNA polymerase sigma-70 factor (ECF subfamily)
VPAKDEAKLIDRAKQGDADAVTQLYQAHVQAIYRYVHYRVGDGTVAEDLTADTFLRAIEGLKGYEYRGVPFRAWLYRIAYARIVDYHRAQNRRRHQPLDAANLHADVDLEGSVANQLRIEQLAALLPRLTDQQQDVLILRFVEQCSIEETASLVGKTTGAIKSLQHRALRSLARIFEEEYGAPG